MRLSSKQKEILKIIGTGLVAASALVAPNILQLFKPKNRQEKHYYKKTIKKLFDDKIIYLSGEEIKLSEEGLKLLKLSQAQDITVNDWRNRKEWDGVWHLVCYDVPEPLKKERDCFRRKLIGSNFYQIQLSLWVCPYDCKEGIAIIAQNLGIAPFVAYLNTDHLPNQQKLIGYFDLDS